ncbi:hypothetical protein [Nocardia sp. R6R-6]
MTDEKVGEAAGEAATPRLGFALIRVGDVWLPDTFTRCGSPGTPGGG